MSENANNEMTSLKVYIGTTFVDNNVLNRVKITCGDVATKAQLYTWTGQLDWLCDTGVLNLQ